MGSQRLREINATLENLGKLEQKVGYEFQRLIKRIENIGRSDYFMYKAEIYRDNFLEELETLKNNYSGFEPIYEKFKSITNPIEFFEIAQRSQALQDFFSWYKKPENYAEFKTADDLAEYILNEYNL